MEIFGPISKRGSKAWWSIKPRYFLLTKMPNGIYKLEYYSDEKREKMKGVFFIDPPIDVEYTIIRKGISAIGPHEEPHQPTRGPREELHESSDVIIRNYHGQTLTFKPSSRVEHDNLMFLMDYLLGTTFTTSFNFDQYPTGGGGRKKIKTHKKRKSRSHQKRMRRSTHKTRK